MSSNDNNQPVNTNDSQSTVTKRPRGFAAMDRERVRAIAALGGKAAHALGTAHQWNSEQAREAGRKGGVAPHVSRGGRRPLTQPTDTNSNPTE